MAQAAAVAQQNTRRDLQAVAQEEASADEQRQEMENAEQAYQNSLVGPLDALFLAVLFLALIADAIDIILEILGVAIVPKLLGMALDVLTLPVAAWVAHKRGDIEQARGLRDDIVKQYNQQMRHEQRQAARARRSRRARSRVSLRRAFPGGGWRAWRRPLFYFVLELIPFVGILPFWTLAVIGAARKK